MLVALIHWTSQILAQFSYAGVFALMAIDSANIPIPSEVVLGFTGFLVGQGAMNLHLAVLSSAFGSMVGSLLAYVISYYGGRPLVDRYGKYLLIHTDDVALAEAWLQRHGEMIYFFGRFIPIVRTFFSTTAGLLHARLVPFLLYGFFATVLWSYFFVGLGSIFGARWLVIEPIMARFQWVVIGLLAAAVVWYVHRHVKRRGKLIQNKCP